MVGRYRNSRRVDYFVPGSDASDGRPVTATDSTVPSCIALALEREDEDDGDVDDFS